MHIVLWVVQVLLALHTAMGGGWKFVNSEQGVPSLSVIPHGLWLTMGVIELFCAVALIIPAINRRLAALATIAAAYIAAEMLVFCAMEIATHRPDWGHVLYWVIVAAVSAFVIYGRRFKPAVATPTPA